MANVRLVRLLSGEELLGDVVLNGDGTITIKDVCQVATSYADPGQATAKVGIAPYLPYANLEKGIRLGNHYIGYIVEPVKELYNEYNKVFGSGIILPDDEIKPAVATPKFVKG